MQRNEVTLLANKLLAEHNLLEKGWSFSLFNGKNKLGLCYHHRREIQFSKHYLMLTDEEILDTLLHEIAHALAGPKAGHGYEWKQICRRIGATPSAMAQNLTAQPVTKWTGVCPNGHTIGRHALTEKSKRIACGKCCNELNNGRHSSLYLFTFHLTEDYVASPVTVREPAAARTHKPGFEGLTIINF